MWFLFGEVSSSSGCLGWATLLWHSLSLPYNYFDLNELTSNFYASKFFGNSSGLEISNASYFTGQLP